MLKIIDYSKVYSNGKIGAENINLTVESGDLFAFIGPNGAGKTTTIKSIVGISDITSGDILLNGVSVKSDPIKVKSMLAYIPDNPDIYKSLTGAEYINLISDIYRVSKEERAMLTHKYSSLLGIEKDLATPISNYSHGMRQKLVIIASLVHSPKLLVLDEPFVGLDPKASFEVKELMKEFCKGGGAIFFSTHVLEVAEKLCNKVAIIKDGKIVVSGTMKDIKQNKSLEEVFLGVANE